jgi:ElaB/YqjD/DUF883 family membrane-anchored ribosome-binding protein
MTETVVDKAAWMKDGVSSFFAKGADLASSVGGTIGETSADVIRTIEKSVKRNPLAAIGIAFAGGLLLGGVALFFLRRGRAARDQGAS